MRQKVRKKKGERERETKRRDREKGEIKKEI